MTPAQFVKKWSDSQLRERQASQSHFNDLCALLGVPNPIEDDPVGERYCFERGASKTGGGDGWADVWRKGCFGWEYKGKHKNLDAALRQLQAYALDLQNPPYLVVSDMERIIVHTNWTNTVSRKLVFTLDDMLDPERLAVLRLVFEGSESLKPKISPQELTAKVAQRFGDLGRRLQERGHNPRDVAHFLNRLVFCMFAEDAKLLPEGLFTRLTRSMQLRPAAETAPQFNELFAKMSVGGLFGADVIKWFNGGLFDDKPALPLERADVKLICDTAAEHDWSDLDPSVFGNMFQEALKATRERAALGAYYTDREKILKIIDPVITWPLMAEWDAALAKIREALDARAAAEVERKAVLEAAAEAMRQDPVKAKAGEAARRKALTAIAKRSDAALGQAKDHLEAFLGRLSRFRVLDPACGSGNFLYVALHALKDIERRALVDAQRLGLEVPAPRVGLACVRGIEIEEYAAELARVTLWIGDLQWNAKNNYTGLAEPILSSLDQIECRDALLNKDGTEAEWPAVDVIVGNPPFVGDKKQKELIKQNDLERIRARYDGLVPKSANLVAYWFYKAGELLVSGRVSSFGFVATQAIRRGGSRSVVQSILDRGAYIFDAWSNELWEQDGAQVRVSHVCVSMPGQQRFIRLDGSVSTAISADLRADVAQVRPSTLSENKGFAAQGTISGGPFELPPAKAREFLALPVNVNGKHNRDIIRRWANGDDLTDRPSDWWIIDFGDEYTEQEASLFEVPFAWLRASWDKAQEAQRIAGKPPLREGEPRAKATWWILQRRRSKLLEEISSMSRYIATVRVSKHRFFVWMDCDIIPDTRLVVVKKSDDVAFGLLESSPHRVWSLRFGGNHGAGNDPEYIHTATFETFPFPEGLTPNIPAADYANDPRAQAIAAAATELNRLREAWLNPPDLVKIEPEVVPGYPDRILPVSPEAAAELKKRTLTNLYNQRPAWLDMAHQRLDAAVAAAYGWPEGLSDDEVLERLFALNQERAAAGR